MPIIGSVTRTRRSREAVSLGRSARTASVLRMAAATEPPTKKNAAVMCSISSH